MNPAIDNDNAVVQALLNDHPSPLSLLRRAADNHPDKTALVFLPTADSTTPVSVSYRELLGQTEQIAAAMRAHGVAPDESVAIFLPLVPQAVPTLIAAMSVAVAFPVNLLLSSDALVSQFRLSRTRLVISMGPHPAMDVRDRVGKALAAGRDDTTLVELPMGSGTTPDALPWEDFLSQGQETNTSLADEPNRVATLVHTGGTTSDPKLAALTQSNLAAGALITAAGFGYRPDERIVSGLPLFHVAGLVDIMLGTIAAQSTLILPTPQGGRNPELIQRFWPVFNRLEGTIATGVPTMLSAICDIPRDGLETPTLRSSLTGGAPLPTDLARRVEQSTGCPVYQIYGMTETAGITCSQYQDGGFQDYCAGRPGPLTQIALGKPGTPVVPGVQGELFVKGPQVFAGYITQSGLRRDDQDGWVSSGDLAVMDEEGNVRLTGRSKEIIIRSGHNIDPQVIEEVAMEHPAVAEAAAIAMPDAYAGELPILYVRYHADQEVDGQALQDYIAGQINEPPARPKRIFSLEEFPHTPVGKVARYRLRQFAAEEAAGAALSHHGVRGVATALDTAAKTIGIRSEQALTPEQTREISDEFQRLGLTADFTA